MHQFSINHKSEDIIGFLFFGERYFDESVVPGRTSMCKICGRSHVQRLRPALATIWGSRMEARDATRLCLGNLHWSRPKHTKPFRLLYLFAGRCWQLPSRHSWWEPWLTHYALHTTLLNMYIRRRLYKVGNSCHRWAAPLVGKSMMDNPPHSCICADL